MQIPEHAIVSPSDGVEVTHFVSPHEFANFVSLDVSGLIQKKSPHQMVGQFSFGRFFDKLIQRNSKAGLQIFSTCLPCTHPGLRSKADFRAPL